MDGNRRFAALNECEEKYGHQSGARKLSEVFRWCSELNVRVLSVYALSTDNYYKRDKKEIDDLMDLCAQELPRLADSEDVKRVNARIIISGDLSVLPEKARAAAKYATEKTRGGKGPVLNVCLAYSGRGDFARALREVMIDESTNAASNGRGITEADIKKRLYGNVDVDESSSESDEDDKLRNSNGHSGENGIVKSKVLPRKKDSKRTNKVDLIGDVDVLVRTSGVTRLSGFLTPRLEKAILVFVDALWPDFSLLDFFGVIWTYQRNISTKRKS